MTEKTYEYEMYKRMRYAIIGNSASKFVPIELLMEWDRVRLRINPNAKPQNLLKYENVSLVGKQSLK